MANTIKIKNSGTASAVPGSLEHGELGLNYADGKIFFKNLSNTITEFTTPPNLVIQNTAPANTSVIWADTSVTGVGVVPTGGTTGQVLSKASNTSYDAAWANAITSSDLALKANIASPTFTGTVTIPAGASISGFAPLANAALTGVPTAPTATAATNTTQIATTAFVRTEVANLVASAPAALDTLDELAAALGDDANFATTTATAIGLKANIASPTFTGTPTLPTGTIATTQSAGNNSTAVATTAFVATAVVNPVPQVTVYTSGSGTYTVPSGARWLHVKMVGGGGGGAAGAGTAVNGSAGTNSTFGSTGYAGGGGGGATNDGPGGGGSAVLPTGTTGIAIEGGEGSPNSSPVGTGRGDNMGGSGGNSALGGGAGGIGGSNYANGRNGKANTGGGGSGTGGSNQLDTYAAGGGGAGGYVDCIFTSLSASYSYAVGAGGAGGNNGSRVGGTGGSGVIYVVAYF